MLIGKDLKAWGGRQAAAMLTDAIEAKAAEMGDHVFRFSAGSLTQQAWDFALRLGGDVRIVEGVGVDGKPPEAGLLVGFRDEDAACRFRLRWGGERVGIDKYS